MKIFQTAREELHSQVKKYSKYINGRVLDVGAGPASRYRHLFKYTEYILMDTVLYSKDHIIGSADSIPFEKDSFESIVCTQVLGDIYDVEKAFSEFYRVLKSGGVVMITESLFDPLHDEPNDFWRFTDHSLVRLAEDAGFVVEVIDRRGGYHSVIAQMKMRYWIERLHLYNHWYGRLASKFFRLIGSYAMMRDRMDTSGANKLFTHGYILLARKK